MDLYLNDDVTEDMLGSWLDAIYKYHPSLGGIPKNGTTAQFVGPHKDLRQHLRSLQQTKQASDPQSETNDLRSLLSNSQANKQQPPEATRGAKQNRGRGRGNDSNKGKGRGGFQAQGQGRGRGQANNRGRNNNRGGNNNNRNQLIAGLVKLLS